MVEKGSHSGRVQYPIPGKETWGVVVSEPGRWMGSEPLGRPADVLRLKRHPRPVLQVSLPSYCPWKKFLCWIEADSSVEMMERPR